MPCGLGYDGLIAWRSRDEHLMTRAQYQWFSLCNLEREYQDLLECAHSMLSTSRRCVPSIASCFSIWCMFSCILLKLIQRCLDWCLTCLTWAMTFCSLQHVRPLAEFWGPQSVGQQNRETASTASSVQIPSTLNSKAKPLLFISPERFETTLVTKSTTASFWKFCS